MSATTVQGGCRGGGDGRDDSGVRAWAAAPSEVIAKSHVTMIMFPALPR